MRRLLPILLISALLSACDANTVGVVATGLQTAYDTLAKAQTQSQSYTPCLTVAAKSLVSTLSASESGTADPAGATTIIANTSDCLKESIAGAPAATGPAHRYYCPAAQDYYPTIQLCPGAWQIQ